MDFSESTKIVYNRIQKLEPENVSKIIGYLLLQDHGEREMIRLAFSPDNLICSLINKAKTELGLSTPSPTVSIPISEIDLQFTPYSPSSSHLITPNSYWDSVSEDYHLLNQIQLLSLEDQLESVNSINGLDFSSNNNNYFYPEPALGVRTSRRSPSLLDSPFKACHYFSKGFCRHGNNCRYFHGHPMPENFSQIFGPLSNNSNELIITNDHQDHGVISPVSLDKLEVEIIEILKSRRGVPVSIASLPLIYFEKYGKTLQADGYLTESQRHGKAGYNLTKLLARLQNNIRLIDRPHGQHSIILAEDILKYLEYSGERFEPSGIVAGSQQIYLTFPAMSAFTEQDVSNYFNQFGPVQDVRIPCQQKRMFGFVTFVFAETVKEILAKGNPHFVCGARVLVKPYREKSRVFERKCGGAENSQLPLYFNQHFMDGDSDLHSMPRVCDNPRFMRKRFIEENEQARQLDQNHLQFAMKNWSSHPYFGYSMEEFKHPEGRVEQAEFPSAERFNYLLDVLNNGSTSSEDQHSRT